MLFHDIELSELQEQLFGADITELNSCFFVVASAFELHNSTNTKALMLYTCSLAQIAGDEGADETAGDDERTGLKRPPLAISS